MYYQEQIKVATNLRLTYTTTLFTISLSLSSQLCFTLFGSEFLTCNTVDFPSPNTHSASAFARDSEQLHFPSRYCKRQVLWVLSISSRLLRLLPPTILLFRGKRGNLLFFPELRGQKLEVCPITYPSAHTHYRKVQKQDW